MARALKYFDDREELVRANAHALLVPRILGPLVGLGHGRDPEQKEQDRPEGKGALHGRDPFPQGRRDERPGREQEPEREQRKREPRSVEHRDQGQEVESPEERVPSEAPSGALDQKQHPADDRDDAPCGGDQLAQIPLQVVEGVFHHYRGESTRVLPHDVQERPDLVAAAIEILVPVPLAVHRVPHVDVVRVGERIPRVHGVDDQPGKRRGEEAGRPDPGPSKADGGRSLRRPDKQQERERAGPQEETVVPGRERPAAEQP